MAQMSEETLAIIDRLKAEGQLIRNTGTNSLRSVKVELRKFDKVFDVIAQNSTAQREMLAIQTNMIEQNAERARSEADFNDLEREAKVKVDKKSSKDSDAKINKMGDAISKGIGAFNLKNAMRLGGGVLALGAGYNVLKGFMNDKYGGAFSEMESNLGKMARSMAAFDPKTLTTSLDKMTTNIEEMNQTFTDLKDDIDKVKNNILVALGTALLQIPLGIAVTRGILKKRDANLLRQNKLIEAENARLKAELDAKGTPKGLFDSPDPLDSPKKFNTDSGFSSRGTPDPTINRLTPTSRLNPHAPISPLRVVTSAPDAPYVPNSRQSTQGGMGNSFSRTPTPSVVGRGDPRKFGEFDRPVANSNGAPRTSPDAVVTRSVLNDALKQLDNPKLRKFMVKLFDFLGKMNVAFRVADLIILMAIMDSMDPDERLRNLGGHIGGMVGALGGMTAGAVAGLMGGPFAWLTVPVGGLAGSILGGFAGDYLGYYVVKWLMEDEVSAAEKKDAQSKVDAAINQRQVPVAYGSGRLRGQMGTVPVGHEMNALDAISDQRHIYNGGSLGSYDYRAKRISTGTNASMTMDQATRTARAAQYRMAEENGTNGGGGTVIIGGTTVAPVNHTVQGAKTQTSMSVLQMGGGGMGFGASIALPDFLS